MRVIIAGSRTIEDFDALCQFISETEFDVTEIVHGGAKGVDRLAKRFAKEYGIPCKEFKPDWDLYGKSAGPIRNEEMAKYADALIAIWDGKSKGTQDMIRKAKKHGLEVEVRIY